jgi:hypothetical protein
LKSTRIESLVNRTLKNGPAVATALFFGGASPASAEDATTTTTTVKGAAPPDLKAVVEGFQTWLLGFATALAILAMTVAGIFYLFSAGNPTQVERAKLIVRATVIGYSLMVLSGIVVSALQEVVG